MNYSEWTKTPYAKTKAKKTDQDLGRLFDKYEIDQYSFARGKLDGRPAYQVRFVMNGKPYRIKLDVLDCPDAEDSDLIDQVKRVVLHQLKSMLEVANVFFTPEEILFAFLEITEGETLFEMAKGKLNSPKEVKGFLNA